MCILYVVLISNYDSNDDDTHLSLNQKLKAILNYIGELSTKPEAQSSSSESTSPKTMQNQPPIPPPNQSIPPPDQPPILPPKPLTMHLSRALKELVALTLD